MYERFSLADLKTALRNGAYAWPGGYPLYFIASDGEALSFDAVRANIKEIMTAIHRRDDSGWRIVAVDTNWENSSLFCAHTNARIPSAYCEEEI